MNNSHSDSQSLAPSNLNSQLLNSPLCGHASSNFYKRGFKWICSECSSFWDLDSLRKGFEYSDDYASERAHFDPTIGQNKSDTLLHWLKKVDVQPKYLKELNTCELGFGSGFCLAFLSQNSKKVFGIEAQKGNIAHAIQLGVPQEQVFHVDTIPEYLPEKIDLWIFQDSFEHILDLQKFMPWLINNSARDAKVLIVCPRGDSLSSKLLGKLWPHKLPDHSFHWSLKGIDQLWSSFNFQVKQTFNPVKKITVSMIFRHLEMKLPFRIPRSLDRMLGSISLWFNFGEMGLYLERKK